jgi:1L-myo-inositol 1-phosphate cytidylyltransferase / CDP-L-myo-inositol myo-inositolphosphotransferase
LDEIIADEFTENTNKRIFIIKANALLDYRILDLLLRRSSNNTVAAITINKATHTSPTMPASAGTRQNDPVGLADRSFWQVSSENTSTNNITANSKVKDNLNGGIIVLSHRIKDYLTAANSDFSFQRLAEKLKKENLLKIVDISNYLYEEINSQSDLLSAEKKLYRSLGSTIDSPILDKYVIRKLSGLVSKLSIRTPVTPNQITIMSLLFGLLAGFLFSFGGYTYNIAAGLLYFFSVVLDQCDGEVARLKYMESKYGSVLDIICDTLVNFALVAGITYTLYKTDDSGSIIIIVLGISAMAGISISTFLTTYAAVNNKDQMYDKTRKWIDKLNNKDFFYIIIFICIAINQMIWFLLIMAIGTNIYWITRKIVHR